MVRHAVQLHARGVIMPPKHQGCGGIGTPCACGYHSNSNRRAPLTRKASNCAPHGNGLRKTIHVTYCLKTALGVSCANAHTHTNAQHPPVRVSRRAVSVQKYKHTSPEVKLTTTHLGPCPRGWVVVEGESTTKIGKRGTNVEGNATP